MEEAPWYPGGRAATNEKLFERMRSNSRPMIRGAEYQYVAA